jgi:hypothetical protein
MKSEITVDQAALGVRVPRASPRTALTLTTHHFNQRNCPGRPKYPVFGQPSAEDSRKARTRSTYGDLS